MDAEKISDIKLRTSATAPLCQHVYIGIKKICWHTHAAAEDALPPCCLCRQAARRRRHTATATLPLPTSRRATDAANAALLPSCRLRRQAGRRCQCRALAKLPPPSWPLPPRCHRASAATAFPFVSIVIVDLSNLSSSFISLTHSPTPPKCSTRAIMALINNLDIVYHQYCSSSYLDYLRRSRPILLLSAMDIKFELDTNKAA